MTYFSLFHVEKMCFYILLRPCLPFAASLLLESHSLTGVSCGENTYLLYFVLCNFCFHVLNEKIQSKKSKQNRGSDLTALEMDELTVILMEV